MNIRSGFRPQCESLEGRLCLSVSAGLAGASLLVEGDSAGPVEVRAIDDDSYQVLENGAEVATVDGVRGHLLVRLGDSDDAVTIDLGGQTVRRHAIIDLGDGNNSLTVRNGTVHGHLVVKGGSGTDDVDIQSDATIRRNTRILLEDGDN